MHKWDTLDVLDNIVEFTRAISRAPRANHAHRCHVTANTRRCQKLVAASYKMYCKVCIVFMAFATRATQLKPVIYHIDVVMFLRNDVFVLGIENIVANYYNRVCAINT
jgi:hypothetical protein